MDDQPKIVSKSTLDKLLDGFRGWRAKKAKVDDDPWGQPEEDHVYIRIIRAILNAIMNVVFSLCRPIPLAGLVAAAYMFFIVLQHKEVQEIEANAINPQIEQSSPLQAMPPTEHELHMESINEQIDRVKAMIKELEASNQRQTENLERIEAILKERHGVIIE